MPRRPTIQDLAKAAGVGTATVDRALNNRGGVSTRTQHAVADAAARIGYPLPSSMTGGRVGPPVSLGFVLHKPSQDFYKRFSQEITTACAAVSEARVTPHIHFCPSQSPDDFVTTIEAAARDSQVIAATAINHPLLPRLVEALRHRDISVYALLNDFAGRSGAGYFGLDNLRVGRIAGWAMATRLQQPCRVAVFVGGARWHGQGLREAGFRAALREHAPWITVTDTAVNLETRHVTYEATLDLLQRHTDLAGLYVAGGGMEGAIAALREARPPNKVALIVNELTAESRAALADGYVIFALATPLRALCQALVPRMLGTAREGPQPPAQATVFDPRLYTPESV